jgi:Zn-dependent protease with chaperone function
MVFLPGPQKRTKETKTIFLPDYSPFAVSKLGTAGTPSLPLRNLTVSPADQVAWKITLRLAAWVALLYIRVRIWWNWQTRYFEVVVPQGMQVQVLLCAPLFLLKLGNLHRVCKKQRPNG